MDDQQLLKKPPITEAIFDIKVVPLASEQLNKLDISSSIEEEFPKKQVAIEYKGSLQVKNDEEPQQSIAKKENGFLFRNNEGTKVVQFRLDGFTFNRVNSYDSWKSFQSEALQFWETYKNIVGNYKIDRIALRYVNKIIVPEETPKLEDYFNLRPCTPDMPLDLSSFFMQTSFVNEEEEISSQIITTVDQKTMKEHTTSFILDIDVFQMGALLDHQLESRFDKLRNMKNDIFFAAVTDKCKNLFE